MVKFGIEFVPDKPYWKTIFYAIQAEKRGFDNLWITDHFNNRNVYVTLTAAALYTQRIRLGPGVTNPYLINPVVTAQAVASLNEISDGRVIFGIGAGDKTTLRSTGVEMRKPLAAVKECVQIVRRMIREKSLTFEGEIFQARDAKFFFKPRKEIPVYVGAQGPKMLAMAGRIGDGVLINAGHPKDVNYAVGRVKKGLEQAGKKMSDVDVAAYTSFSVHEKVE
ncbi:5,10-methylenetetrahydromethanopterin reductase, partial [Candidatus Bathyarchaeota archaeon]|nr:5,10-methylenetetrahydromethanopterin reductase [Candidatus Bathyarchaeota archaeon]NIR15951.1 5,10-methylenetetrahydromethanopterin reductase [Desulfobacterales bacterium]NIU81301.1 5,10-methylenetetrahydromethanopterin reductase [Candidatus Bathyarchaeota archaeon]NIV68179.1 5,10-methylenetetrahydromethanopterin reductase [Candidatus Bathyarchaeota archaeon]NIW16291.1 5,10-methylenetetrahydromethanopterin reductase [Candidatus Bathyarchaeota archaeon]